MLAGADPVQVQRLVLQTAAHPQQPGADDGPAGREGFTDLAWPPAGWGAS